MPSVLAQTFSSHEGRLAHGTRASQAAPGSALSDAELLALVHAGGAGAKERIYTRLMPLVNRLVWSLLGADAEHNDLVHEIFLRIFKNIRTLRQAESLEGWAARLAINVVRNELRKRRLRRWIFWSDDEAARTLHYVSDLDGRELLARAYAALDKLPANERMLLSLRLFETKTLEELVPLLNCSLATLKRRLRRAHARFTRLARQDSLLAEWIERNASTEEESGD